MNYEDCKREAIEALVKVDPCQPYGTELFNAIARVSVSVAIEAIGIRRNPESDKLEVLLMKRSVNAPAYSSMWHLPGSFLRPGESILDVIDRLAEKEFKASIRFVKQVGLKNNPHEARGHVLHILCLIETEDVSANWFPIDKLPEPIVEHHRQVLIPAGVEAFLAFSV